MKKLHKYINNVYDTGKLRVPLASFRELEAIAEGSQTTTINSTVKEILDKCGVKTKPEGIGWRII